MRSRAGRVVARLCLRRSMPPRSCSAGRFWRCPSWDSPRLLSIFAVALHEGVGRRVCGPDECQCSIDGETAMEVILLERVAKLGQMGDVVRVKDGFARNYLLPKGKALRATKDNRTRFEKMKVELEARNLAQKGDAEKIAQKLDDRIAQGACFAAPRSRSDNQRQRRAQRRRGSTARPRRGHHRRPRGRRGSRRGGRSGGGGLLRAGSRPGAPDA